MGYDHILRFFPRPYTRPSLRVFLGTVPRDIAMLFKMRFPVFNNEICIFILNN